MGSEVPSGTAAHHPVIVNINVYGDIFYQDYDTVMRIYVNELSLRLVVGHYFVRRIIV